MTHLSGPQLQCELPVQVNSCRLQERWSTTLRGNQLPELFPAATPIFSVSISLRAPAFRRGDSVVFDHRRYFANVSVDSFLEPYWKGVSCVHFMRGCSASRSNLGRIAAEALAPVWNRVLPTSAIRPFKKTHRFVPWWTFIRSRRTMPLHWADFGWLWLTAPLASEPFGADMSWPALTGQQMMTSSLFGVLAPGVSLSRFCVRRSTSSRRDLYFRGLNIRCGTDHRQHAIARSLGVRCSKGRSQNRSNTCLWITCSCNGNDSASSRKENGRAAITTA